MDCLMFYIKQSQHEMLQTHVKLHMLTQSAYGVLHKFADEISSIWQFVKLNAHLLTWDVI